MTLIEEQIVEMLRESNAIEREYSDEALEDAIKAWEYARENDKKINLEWLLEIHRILMERLVPEIAGKLRDGDVRIIIYNSSFKEWIGGKQCRFISHALLKGEVNTALSFITNKSKTPEEAAREAHIHFEFIHPFFDGNGRTGRILYNIHRLKLGLPIHVIHEGKEQHEYYKWFQ